MSFNSNGDGSPTTRWRLFTRNEGDTRNNDAPPREVIEDYFCQYGDVIDVYHPRKQPRVCYVSFADEQSLNAALDMQEHTVGNTYLSVHRASARTPAEQAPAPAPKQTDRVFLTGVSDALCQNNGQELRDYFACFGEVSDVFIPVDKHSGKPKNIAFVTFMNANDAQDAIQEGHHNVTVDGVSFSFSAQEARPRDTKDAPRETQSGGLSSSHGYGRARGGSVSEYPSRNELAEPGKYRVVIFGVPADLNTDMMLGHFGHYGDVVDIFIPPTKTNMAYVSFGSRMALQACLVDGKLKIAGHTVREVIQADSRRESDRDRDRDHRGGGGGDFGMGRRVDRSERGRPSRISRPY